MKAYHWSRMHTICLHNRLVVRALTWGDTRVVGLETKAELDSIPEITFNNDRLPENIYPYTIGQYSSRN